MLESVDFSLEPLPKQDYKERYDALIEELVVLQQQAREHSVGLVVLFEGWNGAGKGSRISDLMYNLDARATSVYLTKNLDIKEARRFPGRAWGVTGFFPEMQEFWKALGARGTMTFYDRGWYTSAVQHMLYTEFGNLELPDWKSGSKGKKARAAAKKQLMKQHKKHRKSQAACISRHSQLVGERANEPLARYLTSAEDFERQLVNDGYTVVKFFVHMTKEGQQKRLTKLHDDPATAWRVSEDKLSSIGNYDQAYEFYDMLLEGSNFNYAPWTILNGEDKRRTNLQIADVLVGAFKTALDAQSDPATAEAAAKAQAHSTGTAPNPAASDGSAAIAGAPVAGSWKDVGTKAATEAMRAADEARMQALRATAEAEAAKASELAPKASRFATLADYPHLDNVDHTLALPRDEYRAELKRLQKELDTLQKEMFQKRVPLVLMYEGWDAAGKGGNIKRVAQALDARAYTIFPSPAPTKPELMHPFLWRYWTRLPKAGHVGIYDRSWYGRVLVERVEGFATPQEWGRAYDEINEFERELVRWGAVLLKFWVEVSPDEQLRRFEERQADPAKQWKITEDDWRNRDKYPQYKAAINDMFRLTSTPFAPWTVLESDNKYYARIKALKAINRALEDRLRER